MHGFFLQQINSTFLPLTHGGAPQVHGRIVGGDWESVSNYIDVDVAIQIINLYRTWLALLVGVKLAWSVH